MQLTRLEADRLRNLKAVGLELPAGLTLVFGRNGQGKTSLLESVYLLGTGRSFKTRRNEDLVYWEGGPLRVSGKIDARRGRFELAVVIDNGERRLLADGAELEIEPYLGRLDLVDLTAERMNVLRSGPEQRRRFLDRGVVGLGPHYLRSLGEYRRVLQQRNALLRHGGSVASRLAELEVWDERLSAAAAAVHVERRRYAVRLGSCLGEIERAMFPAGRELRLHYRPSPSRTQSASAQDFESVFRDALASGRSRDVAVGHTCQGPHRDELLVELDGVDLRRFGSAGQVRAAMIALKLGKLSLLREERGEAPLFLMDDFDTDLDEIRAADLAGFLQQGSFQALVATSKESLAERLGVDFMKIRMVDGEALTT